MRLSLRSSSRKSLALHRPVIVRRSLCFVFAVIACATLCSASAFAQQQQANNFVPPSPSPTPVIAPPPEADDNVIIAVSPAETLSDGTLRYKLKINRVVGTTVEGGRLRDPYRLMRNGVVAGKAKLYLGMKVELADNGGGPCCGCPCGWETTCCYLRPDLGDVSKEWSSAANDANAVSVPGRVTFNGLFAGYMRADADGQTQSIEIYTEWIRFGTRTPNGEPTAGENILEVTPIGELTLGGVRRTTPAWVALEFQAMYPVVMIHGNSSCGEFFAGDYTTPCDGKRDVPIEESFLAPFIEKGFPYDNSINLQQATIQRNGDRLLELIPAKAKQLGVNRIHIVTHSKGGLNARYFLTQLKRTDLAVLSLITLSTPHAGSVGADYQVDARSGALFADNKTRAVIAMLVPPNEGTYDLRVSRVAEFNQENLSNLPKEFTVNGRTTPIHYLALAADANLDNSIRDGSSYDHFEPTITLGETKGMPYVLPHRAGIGKGRAFQLLYRLLGQVESTQIEYVPVAFVTPRGRVRILKRIVENRYKDYFRYNDFAVTVDSARHMPNTIVPPFEFAETRERPGGTHEVFLLKANHATISSPEFGNRVIESLRIIQPINSEEK